MDASLRLSLVKVKRAPVWTGNRIKTRKIKEEGFSGCKVKYEKVPKILFKQIKDKT